MSLGFWDKKIYIAPIWIDNSWMEAVNDVFLSPFSCPSSVPITFLNAIYVYKYP